MSHECWLHNTVVFLVLQKRVPVIVSVVVTIVVPAAKEGESGTTSNNIDISIGNLNTIRSNYNSNRENIGGRAWPTNCTSANCITLVFTSSR